MADNIKERRLQQVVNAAQSLQVLAEQSSVYIPTSNSLTKLPAYLRMEKNSPWHIGAVQSVAIESMTIPSRLRSSNGRPGTLSDLEQTMNSTGKRRVAKLEMSVADPDVLSENTSEGIAKAEKVGSTVSPQDGEDDENEMTQFDMDVFTRDYRTTSTRRSRKKEHIFGRVESLRGEWNIASSAESHDPQDRFKEGPVVTRYVKVTSFQIHTSPGYEERNKLTTSFRLGSDSVTVIRALKLITTLKQRIT